MKNLGIEIIGDLKGIPPRLLESLDLVQTQTSISGLIESFGFHELGQYYHDFEPGMTGAVVLMESHVAFHTWPEHGYVSLNVFTCNYTRDNDQNAIDLFDAIAKIFQPTVIDKTIVYRDHELISKEV